MSGVGRCFFIIVEPRAYCGDISCVPPRKGFIYLAVFMVWYFRNIIVLTAGD